MRTTPYFIWSGPRFSYSFYHFRCFLSWISSFFLFPFSFSRQTLLLEQMAVKSFPGALARGVLSGRCIGHFDGVLFGWVTFAFLFRVSSPFLYIGRPREEQCLFQDILGSKLKPLQGPLLFNFPLRPALTYHPSSFPTLYFPSLPS